MKPEEISAANAIYDYLEVNGNWRHAPNLSTETSAFEVALQSLKSREGLSITRWGDGEGLVLGYLNRKFEASGMLSISSSSMADPLLRLLESNADFMWKRWFGESILKTPEAALHSYFQESRKAIRNSDFVGVQATSVKLSREGRDPARRSLGVLLAQEAVTTERKRLARDERVNFFFNVNLVRRRRLVSLIQEARNILVVTSREQAGKVIESMSSQNVAIVLIPADFAHRHGSGDKHESLLSHWDNLSSKILVGWRDWDLVLVGAGFLGKPLILQAGDRGAVSLDIGSAMDALAGISTRPWIHEYMEDQQV